MKSGECGLKDSYLRYIFWQLLMGRPILFGCRGLHQDDPLSSFHFTLVVDVLSQMLLKG